MKYIICSFNYRNSNAGVRVLYELQKHLIRHGRDAVVGTLIYKEDGFINQGPCLAEDDDVVVYPEIVTNNPFYSNKVVRYLLRPPILYNNLNLENSNLIVSYSQGIADCAKQYFGMESILLNTPIGIENFFRNEGRERDTNCYWVGKGKKEPNEVLKNCVEITYTWPGRRKDLAHLLNRTNTLYTFDDRTSLADEARMCGCKVYLIHDGRAWAYPHPLPDHNQFEEQLQEFMVRCESL